MRGARESEERVRGVKPGMVRDRVECAEEEDAAERDEGDTSHVGHGGGELRDDEEELSLFCCG